RNVYPFEGIRNFLHGEWIHRSARADPEDVDACLETRIHMRCICNFGSYWKTCLDLSLSKPTQTFDTRPFILTRPRSWFPDSRAQCVYLSSCSQLFGCHDCLFFGFSAAWPTYNQGLVLRWKPR